MLFDLVGVAAAAQRAQPRCAAGKGSDFRIGQGTFLADIPRAMRQRGEARAAAPQLVIEPFDGAGDRGGLFHVAPQSIS